MENQRFFDVFAFLAECFTDGLRRALDKREGFKELRTRGCDGPIAFELKYREEPGTPIITYHLSINENAEGPFVETEWLQWRRGSRGKHVRFLNFHHGKGSVIPGETPNKTDKPIDEQLDDPHNDRSKYVWSIHTSPARQCPSALYYRLVSLRPFYRCHAPSNQ